MSQDINPLNPISFFKGEVMNTREILGFIATFFIIACILGILSSYDSSGDNSIFTVDPSTLEWGNLTRGQLVTQLVNITNHGDIDSLPLALGVSWVSPASPIASVSWNGTGTILPPQATQTYQIQLIVYSNITYTGAFSFNINISEQT